MKKTKIKLRKLKVSDSKIVYKLFSNDNVLRNLAITKSANELTYKIERNWIINAIKSYNKKKPDSLHLAITVEEVYIGNIGAHKIDFDNEKAEIGYWLGEPYWGKGYGTMAVKVFVKLLINKFNFKRIEACPYSHNIASQRVLEKAGFIYEGERRKVLKKKNKFYDDKIYAIVR
jgi:RimJ/RimL family protein N-acetyltransferase